MEKANELLPEGEELVIHKNNSDGKGNSYGCHENYLVDQFRSLWSNRPTNNAVLYFTANLLRRWKDWFRGTWPDTRRGPISNHATS